MRDHDAGLKLALLLPVYNDWECLRALLQQIDSNLAGRSQPIHVLVMDDCSTQMAPKILFDEPFRHIQQIDLLRLR